MCLGKIMVWKVFQYKNLGMKCSILQETFTKKMIIVIVNLLNEKKPQKSKTLYPKLLLTVQI